MGRGTAPSLVPRPISGAFGDAPARCSVPWGPADGGWLQHRHLFGVARVGGCWELRAGCSVWDTIHMAPAVCGALRASPSGLRAEDQALVHLRWDVNGTVSSEVTRGQQGPALGSWGLGQGEHEVSYLWPPAPSSSSSSSACSPCSPRGRRGRPEPGGAPPARGPRRSGGCWAGPRRTGWAAGLRWAPRGRALLWCETPAGSGGGELGRGAEGGGVTHQASRPPHLVVEREEAGPSSPSTSYPITTTTTRGRRFPPAQPQGILQPLRPPAPGPGCPYLRCP